ncbi:MAG: WecB/TagA/CpsF family glycosyltransferase [Patescibacteria group bacterium]
MLRISLLGIPIDPVTIEEAIRRVEEMLKGSKQCHVMTPNNEMLVEAHRSPTFKQVLIQSDLNLPDSTGLLWAARRNGERIPERVSGVDFVERLCGGLDESASVFFLGGRSGAANGTAEKLQIANCKLQIAGMHEGSPREVDAQEIVDRVNASGAKLLLVAYGAPTQDLWIAKHLSQMPTVRVAMGVGGTFDFLSGNVQRAPRFMRSIGMEWLWRVILQPWRIKRIWTAVVTFPVLVLTSKKQN